MGGMTPTWIVRVGQANRRAAAFQNPAAVALGWAEVRGLGDLHGLELDAVAALVRKPGTNDADTEAAQLLAFRDDVTVGDLVVAPDAASGDVLVGAVTGDYTYDLAGSDYYPHRRPVTWHGRVPAADVPPALADDTHGNVTLRPAASDPDAWLALAHAAEPVTTARRAHDPRATRRGDGEGSTREGGREEAGEEGGGQEAGAPARSPLSQLRLLVAREPVRGRRVVHRVPLLT